MYYEIHGEGDPVVLLHGSYMTIDLNWSELIPQLSKTNQVIALEMQGHGRTADTDREFSYEALADDVAALLKFLKIDSADVIGYSLGGTVAFSFAIRHPEMVNDLVIISSVYKLHGWIKPARDIFATIRPEFFEGTPLKKDYERLAPDKSHWRSFVQKLSAFDNRHFDLGAAKIQGIKSPLLFIKGDNDGVDLNHVTEIFHLFDGDVFGDMVGVSKSQLAIIPGMTHVNLMMQTQKLMEIIPPFLNKTTPPVAAH
jgi:pimeloyl-ACP methyl ester carboxylesterase